MPTIPAKDFFVLGFLLGSVLEESVFRGYLLPVLARAWAADCPSSLWPYCLLPFMPRETLHIGCGLPRLVWYTVLCVWRPEQLQHRRSFI